MKIRPISDGHLEHGPLSISPAGEDILVLAGDICIHTEHMELVRQMATFLDVPVIVLAGNHEFYSHPPDTHTWESTLTDLRAAAHHTDKIVKGEVTFLENSFAVYEGVRFIGATLWTDMKLFGDDPTVQSVIEYSLNDYRFIRKDDGKKIRANDTIERHAVSRQYITERLAEKFDGPTVVVTHHTPSWLSVHPDYKGSKITAAYSSRLETLMLLYGPTLWIHGHTHFSFDYEICKTRVVCNPRGYYPNDLNPDFNPDLIIDIGETMSVNSIEKFAPAGHVELLTSIKVDGVEEWREYDFSGRIYRITSPTLVQFHPGGVTHRVTDSKGVVHIVPAPGQGDCVVRFSGRVVA